MSRWHREHPELAGTDADPWMANEDHARAAREVAGMEAMARAGVSWADIDRLERESSYQCIDYDCHRVQGPGDACVECGGQIELREP
jgi:hypothetical protein